jgi:hypothetical protein
VTYAGRDDFYSGPIAHMVNLVYMDDSRACILDNNRPGVFLWMTRKEFLQRWRDQGGGWAYVFLAPPPPVYKEGAAPPQSLPFAWESEPVGQCPGGNCNQPTLRRLPALRPVPRPDFAGGPWVTVGPDAATGYDYGANLAKKLGQPLVTYVGYRGPMWAGAVTAYVDALEGFPGPCVVVSKWYGESHRGSLLKGTLAQTVAYLDETSKPVEQKPAAVADDEAADSIPNYGIERKRVSQERRYAVNGREVTRFNAFGAFGADSVADDSTKYSLAVVGDAAYRQKIKSEVGSHFELGGKVLVQYYDPSDWAVSQFALKPGLTLREPDAPKVDRSGKELGSSLDLKDILETEAPGGPDAGSDPRADSGTDPRRPEAVAPPDYPRPDPVLPGDPEPSPELQDEGVTPVDDSILPLLKPLLDSPNGPWYVVLAAGVLLLLRKQWPAVAALLPRAWDLLKRLVPSLPKAPVTPPTPSDLRAQALSLLLALLSQSTDVDLDTGRVLALVKAELDKWGGPKTPTEVK